MCATLAEKELEWDPITTFEVGIKKTIKWYLSKEGSIWLNECMVQNAEWLKKTTIIGSSNNSIWLAFFY